ncbi:hypothetical protein GGX14DRAFT_678217 [Mycena pura]|uniref:Uncharacterized protein n=1 Tax=Mycena pura TaxID=153505 RepID=A0AAD6UXN1_9AGAR|nr:hypothetical protein GGX14DRAFT_678217 [Mycena pura]
MGFIATPIFFRGDGTGQPPQTSSMPLNYLTSATLPGWTTRSSNASSSTSSRTAMLNTEHENLVTAFRKEWMEAKRKEKGELQKELLSLVLRLAIEDICNMEGGVLGHVRWAVKVAELAALIEDDGRLIPQALNNIPASLLLRLGPNRATWPDLVQTMREVPSTVIASLRRSYHSKSRLKPSVLCTDHRLRRRSRGYNFSRPIPKLPELLQLPSFFEAPLPEDQKILIPHEQLDVLVVRDYTNICTEDDVRLLFRSGGGESGDQSAKILYKKKINSHWLTRLMATLSRTLTAEAPSHTTITELDKKVREFPPPLDDPDS